MTKVNKENMKELYDTLLNTFCKKNHDYGNSFELSLDKHGLVAGVVRMEDKMNRLSTLVDSDTDAQIASESLVDTLMDLSNYAAMSACWLMGQYDVYNEENLQKIENDLSKESDFNRKKELENILVQIEKEKNQIKKLHDDNLQILKDIRNEVENKTAKIYNAMKAKNAAEIFDQMIDEGKIDDVFDIILKLKENNVTQIMKFLSVTNASIITQKLENYNIENEKKD